MLDSFTEPFNYQHNNKPALLQQIKGYWQAGSVSERTDRLLRWNYQKVWFAMSVCTVTYYLSWLNDIMVKCLRAVFVHVAHVSGDVPINVSLYSQLSFLVSIWFTFGDIVPVYLVRSSMRRRWTLLADLWKHAIWLRTGTGVTSGSHHNDDDVVDDNNVGGDDDDGNWKDSSLCEMQISADSKGKVAIDDIALWVWCG